MEKEKDEELSILDILLDENNDSPISLFDEKDNEVKFDQVAIIPFDDKVYAILKPIDKMDGVADDEAIVFVIQEDEDGDAALVIETDEAKAIKVFDEYYKLLDEQDNEDKKD